MLVCIYAQDPLLVRQSAAGDAPRWKEEEETCAGVWEGGGCIVVALLCSAVLSLSLSSLRISRCERFACICWAMHKGGGQHPSSIRATAAPHRMCMVGFLPYWRGRRRRRMFSIETFGWLVVEQNSGEEMVRFRSLGVRK
jgi:hypothetical protein